jgi:ABC-type Mn2+/Zn2+ transport system permease subunit
MEIVNDLFLFQGSWFDVHLLRVKTILLYGLVIIGIPNFAGLILGAPLALILAPVLGRATTGRFGILSVVVGLSMGVGCGVAGLLLAWLFGQTPNVAIPIVSSIWALIYYYSRGVDKLEGWFYVAGVFGAWGVFWLWPT